MVVPERWNILSLLGSSLARIWMGSHLEALAQNIKVSPEIASELLHSLHRIKAGIVVVTRARFGFVAGTGSAGTSGICRDVSFGEALLEQFVDGRTTLLPRRGRSV